jgi:hypothetical protein
VGSFLSPYGEADCLELLGVWLRFAEPLRDVICFIFRKLHGFGLVAFFINCRLVYLSVFDLLDILLDIDHGSFDVLHLFSVENGRLDHFRDGDFGR